MECQSNKTIIGYSRVSTVDQGVSLDAQKAKIQAWALINDYEILSFHTDALSGGKANNRPGLQAALSRACREKATLVVYSLSRLARSTKDAIEISERLDRAGAGLASLSERIDTSAAGRMIFRLLAALAEFERDQIRERTSNALQHMRIVEKRRVGETPFGWDLNDDNRTLSPNWPEQKILRQISALRKKGHSYGRIANWLEQTGVRTKKGNRNWFAPTVRKLHLNSMIA